jgi:hypothetical protein
LQPKSYLTKKFGPEKYELEKRKASEVIGEGGWFGLTQRSVLEHWELFHNVHHGKYPFVAVERDFDTYYEIKDTTLPDNAVIRLGDIFEYMFNGYGKSGFYKKPIFSYAHLDFCCTAVALTDEKIEYWIRQLAKWWAIRSPFHLDITVSCWGDRNNLASQHVLLDHFIPTAFRQVNWTQTRYWKKTYKDTSAMTTAFYIFSKPKKQVREN